MGSYLELEQTLSCCIRMERRLRGYYETPIEQMPVGRE